MIDGSGNKFTVFQCGLTAGWGSGCGDQAGPTGAIPQAHEDIGAVVPSWASPQ